MSDDKEKIYTAKELFDLIQGDELKTIGAERTRKDLSAQGQKEEDIDVAIKLMACISAVQKRAFNGEQIALIFSPLKFKIYPSTLAMYSPNGGKDSGECYEVFVEGYNESLLDSLKPPTIGLYDKDGKEPKNKIPISMEEELLKKAVHEVRHRFQGRIGFRMFSVKDRSFVDAQLKEIIFFADTIQNIVKRRIEKEGVRSDIIDNVISQPEFDAIVVETLALNKLREGVKSEEFFDLVKIQPPELSSKN